MHGTFDNESLSVAEALKRVHLEGHATRLNWSADDLDATGQAVLTTDEWPTGVLPVIRQDAGRHTYVIHEPHQDQQHPERQARRLADDWQQGENSE